MQVNNRAYFETQLSISEHCEAIFSEWLKERGWDITSIGEKEKGYDIKCNRDGLELLFEVKYNSGIEKYGTAFVETYQSGYPSGLNVTEADYQIHFSEDFRCRGFKTADLIKYIKENDLPLSSTSMITYDGKTSGMGYRVKWEDFPLEIL